MSRITIDDIVSDLRAVADIDFMDVSFIAESVREDLKIEHDEELRSCAMEVIRRLMNRGVFPGDYDHAVTMSFWLGTQDEIAKRIECEWIAMGHTPTLEKNICWFGLKKPDSV